MAKATWIWYPGDWEIWLGNKMNNRRTERGAFFPPFWKQDSHYVTVEFSKRVSLSEDEEIHIAAEGVYNVKIDGRLLFGMPAELALAAGEHVICVKVHNQSAPPALYVSGDSIVTDGSWRVTYEDKEWIDESGKASDTSATLYVDTGCWQFDDINTPPSRYRLARTGKAAASVTRCGEGVLADFGTETFGSVVLKGISGSGIINVYYGESRDEALDKGHCETLDRLSVNGGRVADLSRRLQADRHPSIAADGSADYTVTGAKAFRYVYVECEGCAVDGLSMEYEYQPEECRGSFTCDDDLINRIWQVSAYTLQLTTREFFIDGIKRDRWVWSGDAVQSFLMNYYTFFDSDAVKRTLWLLRGKDPVTSHINTIMDYTFYWFKSIHTYYLYSGDSHFVRQIYPRMKSMMAFVEGRLNADGMAEGLSGDWVFIDWADFPMSKAGALSFEQILLCESLYSLSACAGVAGQDDAAAGYARQGNALRDKLLPFFWDERRQAFVHGVCGGKRDPQVNKFANMFAIMSGLIDGGRKQTIMRSVMLNPDIPPITTPYMRFYELEAICAMGMHEKALSEMRSYWGGMLKQGATTFWEKYNPEESGAQHLAMYGRPYGKSLCHAWGASPLYLLGRYFLGVEPVKPGYEEYAVRPVLGSLRWMEGTVPTPFGGIHVRADSHSATVRSDGGKGTLFFGGKEVPIPANQEVRIDI